MPADTATSDATIDELTDQTGHAVLAAIDETFQDVLHGRFGGGVEARLSRGGTTIDEKTLRQSPSGVSVIEIGLILRDGPNAQHQSGSHATILGIVTMQSPPGRGPDDIDVKTELFDDHDPNEAADAGHLPTGLLLVQAPPGAAGQMPGGGLRVMRSGAALGASASAAQQKQRGWLPLQPRGRVNRSGGLGSNGFRRAASSNLARSISRHLLTRLGDRMAAIPGLGDALDQVVLGLHAPAADCA